MKVATLIIYFIVFITACNTQAPKEAVKAVQPILSTGNYGALITEEGALNTSEVSSLLDSDTVAEVKLIGTIQAVCQHSGCWMDLDMGNGKVLKVTFKENAYTIPKDASGKTDIVEGLATRELISVETLKHYAEDEGKSKEEIEAIKEPAWSYAFEASGVIIK